MRRRLAQLLPEGHQSIEKRSCKQPDSNARPKHQNVSFSAHCRSVWGVLSLVLLTTGNVGPSSPTKCSASRTSISLSASSNMSTGVATGSNTQQKHTPQTKVASEAGCRFHIADTQPAPFADGRKQKCCSSECSGEKAERGSMIDQNRVSLSRYPRLSPLPLTFRRKACGEVPDDLNSERESRQSENTPALPRSRRAGITNPKGEHTT
jgi:hypothetical protein